MAHLVAHHKYGARSRGSQRDIHGPHFVDALIRVASVWYGDARRYPWQSEYPAVCKRAGETLRTA